jgi:CubicO group peptidase (beta-lactamase class C family)
MRRARIPGLSIVLADSRGTIWEAGFGWGRDAHTVPVDSSTMFSVQSMSKTFTAVGVLTAVDEGLLALDAPLSRMLPEFTVQSIFETNPKDVMTLRHLLTHTAGFTHEAPGGGNFDPGDPSFDEHVAAIQKTWLMFPVGERYQYSNLGIDLAGYLLERASSRPFVEAMRERVFDPLGLSRTTMDPAVIRAEANRATGHQRGVTDVPVIVPMTAAGGVYTCAHDLGLFLTSMLRKGVNADAILSPAAFRELETTPDHGGYGLGIAIGNRDGGLFLNHGGGGYGFLTWMAWYPTLDIGISVLTNSANHASAHVKLAENIIDLLVEEKLVARRFPLTSLPVCAIELGGKPADNRWYFDAHAGQARWNDDWQRWTGRYRLAVFAKPRWYLRAIARFGLPRSLFVTVKREGDGMTIDGVPLLEAEPDLFFSLNGEALDFRGDPPTWRNVRLSR